MYISCCLFTFFECLVQFFSITVLSNCVILSALVVKNMPANTGVVRDTGSIPGSGRSHGGGHCTPLQSFCLENPMDRGAWWAPSIGSQRVGHNWSDLECTYYQTVSMLEVGDRILVSQIILIYISLVFEHLFLCMYDKAMAPYSSTFAWKIPWMEEPGRLQSMGSLRVGHNWATSLSLITFMHWRRKWQPTPVF